MNEKEFIALLEKSNFSLSVKNGKLILQGDKNKLSADEMKDIKKNDFIINYIKENKNELINYISDSPDFLFEKNSDDISSIYRLSGLQEGMLFHGLYNEKSGGAYIEQLICDLRNPNLDLIKKSWNYILSRHSILRSSFYHDEFNVPVQCVYKKVVIPVTVLDYSDKDSVEQSAVLKKFEEADRLKGFNFKAAPLMRICLIRLNKDLYKMIWTSHHILFDGWSSQILMEEFLNTYEMLASGKEPEKTTEDLFEDYIRYIERIDKDEQERYWRNYIEGIEQATLLPFIETTSERTKGAGAYETVLLNIDQKTTVAAELYVQKNHLTISTLIQGVWSYLLHRYTGNKDIVFGVTVSGRPGDLSAVERRVGLYINTLPLHSTFQESQKISEWLQELQLHQVTTDQYQYTPLHKIQSWTGIKGDLFDSLLVFENHPVSEIVKTRKWSLQVENLQRHEQTNYPLNILAASSDKINIAFRYNTMILKHEYVNEIRDHFENVLLQIIKNEVDCLNDIELITRAEKKQLLSVFNDLSVTYPQDKTIIDLFEEQAAKTPGNIAVVSGREELTYKELDEQSNQLAHYLQSKGVKKETLVPICIERGFDMIVGILGILKAGGVYVPVDPEYPEGRIKYIVEDTSASIVVSSIESSLKLPAIENINIIKIDKDRSKINKKSSGNLKTSVKPHNAAYIIYTSGSTGKPKGVIVEHCNVVRLFKTDKPLFDFTEKDVWTMFHSFCFDFTVWEMYGALFYGGKLVIVPKEVKRDAVSFSELLLNEKVTILNQIPSSFYALQENIVENKIPLNVRYLIFGGEALDPAKLRQWKHVYPNCKIINMYGITETTVHVTYQEIEQKHIESGNSIIGKPIPTLSLYILDRNQKLLPIGIAGELCIGGAGLARGYLNRPELTEERFIKNPYSEENGARLYRSGDLGKRLPDGNIEYLGRIDEQVKIRGYRIELGEIESVLNDCKQVRQAIVLAKEDKESNRYLIAYIIPEGKFEREEIKSYLKGKLPEYMVPSLWVEMESFPIASSGKINKNALPDPDASTLIKNEYIEPKTENEIKTANIWKEVLNVERVGINDNFFELGGDSIKVIRVIHKIRKTFNRELKVFDIYHSGTLSELIKLIENDTLSKNSSDENLRAAENEIAKLKEELLSSIPDAGNIEDMYPMSDIQSGMVYASLLNPEHSIYHDQIVNQLSKKIDPKVFEKALSLMVKKHSILRTAFNLEIHTEGIQIVYKSVPVKAEYFEKPDATDTEATDFVKEYFRKEREVPFEINKAPLWRAALLYLKNQTVFLFQCHHAILDGWSVASFNTELNNIYFNLLSHPELESLPELTCSYKDYVIENIIEKKNDENREFWINEMAEYKRLDIFSPGRSVQLLSKIYSEDFLEILNNKTRQDGISLKALFFGAYLYSLSLLTYEDELTIGLVTNNRPLKEDSDKVLGCFLNTIPFRFKPEENSPTWKDYFQNVENKIKELKRRDRTTLLDIVKLTGEKAPNDNPFFDVLFNFVNFHVLENLEKDVSVNQTEAVKNEKDWVERNIDDTLNYGFTNTYLDCTTNITGKILSVGFSLRRSLKSGKSLKDLSGYFERVINCYLENYENQISSDDIISAHDLELQLAEFNEKKVSYPKNKTVVDLFEEQVKKTSDNIALVFEDQQMTYDELNKRSNQLAHYLQSKGVKEETLVPICMERGMDMIIGILGILKSGGAYVPIDPEYPEDRIQYMFEDTGAFIFVSSKESSIKLSNNEKADIIEIDGDWSEISKQPSVNLKKFIKPDNLAYVIYTSGSTGKPKGVLIEHYNVVRLFKTDSPLFDFNEKDVWTMFHSFCFDFSVWEMYGALLYGGRLVIVPKDVTRDALLFSELLLSEKVTVLNQTPSAFYVLQDILTDKIKSVPVRYVIFGGEALSPAKLMPWKKSYPDCRLVNMFGITETTVHVTYQEVEWQHIEEGRSIIGKPIPTLTAYILDRKNRMSPVGVPGEIFVGGAGLARGYLNRPELTTERFIKDPFSSEAGARLYKTGDLGRWLPDGNMEYLGRVDEQVKIRGYRIELGEIESVLQECESVRQSVVLARETKEGSRRLIGYVVPEGVFDKEAIMHYLGSRLPEYMVPALWVELETLPLTPNGKTDRKALPDPDASELINNEYAAPRNETERVLSEIWKELLHVDRIGINDNFFELGGDSIITIQVLSRARRLGYELKPKDIFIHQTISKLSATIEERSASEVTGEQGLLTGQSGLLPIQQWYFEGAGDENSHFNQSVLLSIHKSVTPEALNKAVEQLTAYHDALRFNYHKKDGQWIQEYGTKKGELITVDLKSSEKSLLGSLIKESADHYQRSLNIENGELVRFVLIQTPETESHNRILIVIHHLAVDGVSWRILLEDLELLLTGIEKEGKAEHGSKGNSYRQWYEALRNYGQSKRLLSQIPYWEKTLRSHEPLAADKEFTGEIRTKNIEIQSIRLSDAHTQMLLQTVPKVYHTEINDLLLCALAKTLCDWNSAEKVVIGLEGHGRENSFDETDTSHTVGWFTNLYPVLLELPLGKNISSEIKAVKELLRRVPDKGLGYGVLKYINKDERLSGSSCFDLIFNYLGQFDNVVSSSKLFSAAGESRGTDSGEEHIVNYKMVVNSMVQGGELILSWGYSNLHYEKETISDLLERYKSNLESLISHCIEKQKSGSVYTPSDYNLGEEISYEELDRFMDESFNGVVRRDSVEGLYRLSGLQQGMLFHAIYDSDSDAGAYTEQLSCDLINPDMEIIKNSWSKVLRHHSILRSGFYYDVFSVPVQCVYKDVELPVTILDFRNMNSTEQASALKEYEEADRLKGFDFKSAPLMRIGLIRLSEDRYRMLWTSHHILFDGWSLPILMEEFLSNYENLISGKEVKIPEEDKYEDYIRYIERGDKEQQENYWRGYMKGVEQSTLLPFIGTTVQRTKGKGKYETVYLNLDGETSAGTELYAQRNRLTINTVMQGIWSYLLHCYTGTDDVVYGIIVSGRPDDLKGIEQRVGLFINTLPLHSVIQNEQQMEKWLYDLQTKQVSSSQFQYTQLQEIQKWTGVNGDLFDSILVFENYPVSEIARSKDWSLQVENMQMKEQTNYPLTIIVGGSEKLSIQFSYNAEILKPEFVKEISGHFENVLNQVISNKAGRINEIQMLTKAEENKLLEEFNNTKAEYPKNKTVVDLFEEQAEKTPDNIALVSGDFKLTYSELNEHSNQLAHYLQSKKLKAESPVPICMERSMEMIIGMLGILKAGGAYVPIDPDYPEDRIRYMIEDTAASIFIISKDTRPNLPVTENIEVIEIDDIQNINSDSEIKKQPSGNLQNKIEPAQLVYVIYTSGSTGRPKGVMIEHINLVNLISWHNRAYNVSENSRATTMAGVGFDAFGWEVWPYLSAGASVTIVNDETRLSSTALLTLFYSNDITHCFMPTAIVQEFVSASRHKLNSLQYLLAGGDKLAGVSIEGESYKLVNNYGPTENTVVASYYELQENDPYIIPPIGKPVSNSAIYILDKNNRIVPIGIPGEICIGGASLARGYLNLPELSKEKFIKDPFINGKQSNSRLYRTGDSGCWLPDGNIEYMGRIDEQVKIRGYRIELGEIESVLQECELVEQAAVLAKETAEGNKKLAAYVVAKGKFNKQDLISFLERKLPEYMVPSLWLEMESLPLTQNGKIDRKALPDPDASDMISNEYEAPRNELEYKMAEIWKELLHTEQIGINDNFFELGGDSIITIQVLNRARRLGYELNPKDIFIHQTIARLSAALAERSASAITGEQGILKGQAGLLPIQQKYFEEEHESISYFNQSVILTIDKSVTPKLLNKAVERLTAQHDSLRFIYHKENGQWKQEYGNVKGELITVDLQSEDESSIGNLIREHADKYQRSLDIEKGELSRFVFIQTPEESTHNRILIIIHHLAVDGVSWRILLDDFEELLSELSKNGKGDPGYKSSSYRQWYEALANYGQSERLLSQLSYWKKAVSSYEPLMIDKKYNGIVREKDFETLTINLDPIQTQLLIQEVPRIYHTEINDILLCALVMTLSGKISSNKITVGLEGHGRENIFEGLNTSRTVGWFTSLYPVLLELNSGGEISEAIKEVKEQLRSVPDKGLGYGVLKYINKDENFSCKEIWDIVFNYLGQRDNVVSSGKWFSGAGESKSSGSSEDHKVSYKLSVTGMIQRGRLVFNWGYSSKHFEKETISELIENYKLNIESLISHCLEQKKSGIVYTPSDYGLGKEINYNELDKFLEEPYNGAPRRESIEGLYRLSGLQQGMIFHSLYDTQAGAYTEQLSCDVLNPDLDIINKSWNFVIRNHSILRSGFYYDVFNIPVQCVYRDAELPVTILDYSKMKPQQQRKAIKEFEEADRKKGFDLKSVPLMRIGLIRLSGDRYRMLWTSHHILFDGWSLSILMEEFLNAYELLNSGKELKVLEEDRYEDYIRYIERADKEQQQKYWRNYMNGVDQSTLLPFIGTTLQRTKGTGNYETVSLNLDKEISAAAEIYAQGNRLTINTIIQGVWSYLLHRYTGSDNIVYGVIVSGRPDELTGMEQRVGLYINTLPLHSVMNREQKIEKWLQDLQSRQAYSGQYQYTPLQEIQGWTGVSGDLFDSILIFENYPVSEIIKSKKWDLKIENVQMEEQTNYPLTISVISADKININFSFNTEILKKEYVKEIRGHFENVLLQILKKGAGTLDDIELLTEAEEKNLQREFNDNEADYPENKTIIDLFEEQVMKTPDNVALEFEDQQMTYRELNERANQLGHYLRSKRVKAEMLVPVCIERSFDMIIGILGILKAGGAYVPIDPEYPEERIKYLLKDTGAEIIVSSKLCTVRLPDSNEVEIISIDEDLLLISSFPKENLIPDIQTNNLAYIIYTSGSSGKPKGVMIEHRSVVNLINAQSKYFNISIDERILQFSNYSFDASIEQIFLALLNGASLVLFPEGLQLDSDRFENFLIEKKISHLHATPSFLENINPDNNRSLKRVIAGGDVCKKELSQNWKNKTVFYNEYGPTETTVTAIEYSDDFNSLVTTNSLPIGKPLANIQVYVLDKNGKNLPVGIEGELCITGDCLARGYLNSPELTSEKFVKNPFSGNEGARMYRTGDLCRRLPDGNIEFIGRMDEQVKIRGYRIEPGEIENVLLESEYVKQAVVLAKLFKDGQKRLTGYVVPEGNFDKEAIINFLHDRLPEYMIPVFWVELENLPLTQNGKIDRNSLPDPDIAEMKDNEYVAPRNETEEKLKEIWEELLGLDRIGINDNFFELGGQSLLAMRAISMIRRKLNSELSIKDLFLNPRISELALHLNTHSKSELLPAIIAEVRPEFVPLSFSQERLYFIDRLEKSIHYHIPAVLRLKGKLNIDALIYSLKSIIKRHEILRTVIREENGVGYQYIKDDADWELQIIDGSKYEGDDDSLRDYIKQLINVPFNLSEDFMIRGHLIILNERDYILVTTLHHIVSDATSTSIMVKELVEFYQSYIENREAKILPLKIQFADYAIWQRNYLQGGVLEKKLEYWKQKLEGTVPLQLPSDYDRPLIQSVRGASRDFKIDKDLSDRLKDLSQTNGTTLFMTLLAAFKILLYRYSGQQDICVGSPISGRQQEETEELIGFFLNTLPLRSEVRSDYSFNELLQQEKAVVLEAYDHQEVPFEKIVEAVVKQRDMSRSPLFQVMFVLLNMQEMPGLRLDDLDISREESTYNISKFDLTLFISETPLGLRGSLEYCTDLYSEDTINRMLGHFEELLHSIAANPNQKVSLLPILTKSEEQQLLMEFNNTLADYPKEKSIIELFEEQASKTPDDTALVFEDQQLTYWELNERSNKLAHYLKTKGVKEETLVPICMERSPEMIIGVIGILKAGGAYVPIDPEYPAERIIFILKDTGSDLMLSSKKTKLSIPETLNIETIETDSLALEIDNQPADNLSVKVEPANLTYVLYTSGSTGNPKGVIMPGSGLVNLLLWQEKQFVNKQRRVLQFTSLNFDVSFQEIFSTLCFGSILYLISAERRIDMKEVLSDIVKNKITHLFIPYIVLKNLAEFISTKTGESYSLEEIITAGEQLKITKDISALLNKGNVRLINQYGPTEAHVVSSYNVDSKSDLPTLPPIGKPVDNIQLYILSNENQPVPIGVTGEIHIGGAQVARGYLNLPDLTEEKFVKNPYSKKAGERIYKTGDLGRWLTDGNIEYLGRTDNQIKLRGYRVEPGEIESVLQQSDLIKQAVILAKKDKEGNYYLTGYVVSKKIFDKEAIVSYLKNKLPEFMIPAFWVDMESLPLTRNGKVDRRALPDPDASELLSNEYVAPRNELESKLAIIWKDLLNIEQVGIYDNFFELGGHSLLAMRVISAISSELGIELAVKDLFKFTNISELSKYLEIQFNIYTEEKDSTEYEQFFI